MKKFLIALSLFFGLAATANAGDINSISYETTVTASGRSVYFELSYWTYGSCTWSSGTFTASGVLDSSGVLHIGGQPPAVYQAYAAIQITVTNGAHSYDVYAGYYPSNYCTYAIMLGTPYHRVTAPPGVDPNPQPGNGLPPDTPPLPPTGPGGPA